MFIDFGIIMECARHYGTAPFCNYPYPFFALLYPLSLIPTGISQWLFFVLNVTILVAITRMRAILLALFIPVLQVLYTGQTDLVFLWLYLFGGWWGLLFLTLKPQLFILCLPKFILLSTRHKIYWLISTGLFYFIFYLQNPGWMGQWLSYLGESNRALSRASSASLWGYPALIVTIPVLVYLVYKQFDINKLQALIMLFIPALRFYDYAFLIRKNTSIINVLFTYLILFVANYQDANYFAVIIGIVYIISQYLVQEQNNRKLSYVN